MPDTLDDASSRGDTPREPGDPQPGEPGTSFAGYVVYRETPTPRRSLRAVAHKLGRSLSLIERYSSRWRWVARTRAWDAAQARLRSTEVSRIEADWVERHMDAGRRLQAVGLAGLARLVESDGDGRGGLRKLKAADLVRMVTGGARVEEAAARHLSGTVEAEFVQAVVSVMAAVFGEPNAHDSPETRAQVFEAGCARAFQELLA